MAEDNCLFCRIVSGEVPATLVYVDKNAVAFLDHRPLFHGHTLLAPRQHVETLVDLPQELIGPFFEAAHKALERGFGKRAVFIREGGSIPFVTQMYDTFKVPCILIGFGLPDENAHAPNEHLLLENYFGGIKATAYFYEELAKA